MMENHLSGVANDIQTRPPAKLNVQSRLSRVLSSFSYPISTSEFNFKREGVTTPHFAVLFLGYFCSFWTLMYMYHPQVNMSVFDVLKVAAYAKQPQTEPVYPSEEVAARARRLDAELLQLRRRQGKERFPGRELGRVLAEAAADDSKEGLHVRYDRNRLRYSRCAALMRPSRRRRECRQDRPWPEQWPQCCL